MAVTKGQGNPNWTKDETILALDLYFKLEGKIPGPNDPRISDLSSFLRELPVHPVELRKDSFRNSDGVGFKLQNIRNVATGKGLDNTSGMDKTVWVEYGHSPELVAQLATRIRSAVPEIGYSSEVDSEITDEETFSEGKIITALHKRRERSPGLRKKVIRIRKARGTIACDICGATTDWSDEIDEAAIYECHHIIPLASGEVRTTRPEDVALLCAICHRAIHAIIVKRREWISPLEARKYMKVRSHEPT